MPTTFYMVNNSPPGSFDLPIDETLVCEARRSGLLWFLSMAQPAQDGDPTPLAVAPEAMFKKATVQSIAARIQAIREAEEADE